MKRKFGALFVFVGILLMLAAAALLVYNRQESRNARISSQSALTAMQAAVEKEISETEGPYPEYVDPYPEYVDPYQDYVDPFDEAAAQIAAKMKEVEINGELYIGYLSIPALELELPVISEWSYERLRIAPCRQFGSTKTDDLVIAAHNYDGHFGRLSQLKTGDLLGFTDMEGEKTLYEVQILDILEPTALSAVKDSEFDLVLYTCTYGGENRVVLFCNRVE